MLMRRTAKSLALVLLVGLAINCGSAARARALATPTLVALEEPGAASAVDRAVFMGAFLNEGQEPGGTITFEVFGASDNECYDTPLATATVPVHGNDYYFSGDGAAGEPNIVIDALGLYPARIRYSGDASNAPVSTLCGQPTLKLDAAPTISLTTQEPPVVGRPVQMIASLLNGVEPTGTITFSVYLTTDQECEEEPLLNVSGEVTDGRVVAPSTFVPTRAGDYPTFVYYGGDQMNLSMLLGCTEAAAIVHVARAQPTLSLTPSPEMVVGEPASAIAVLGGGYVPTGTITFNLYPPADTACAGPPTDTVSAAVAGARASSGTLATSAVGQYRFTALYSGDADNAPADSACGAATVTTSKARPTLAATSRVEGGSGLYIDDRAVIASGFEPSGTVTFTLYGPHASGCSGPEAFRVIAPVIEGAASSGTFSTGGAGSFALLATYSGDAHNQAAVADCQRLGVSGFSASGNVIRVRLGARASRLRLHVVCPRQASVPCRGVIELIAVERLRGGRVVALAASSPRTRRIAVGHAGYDVPAGRTRAIPITISAEGRALARRFSGVPLQVVLQQSSPSDASVRLGR
jgi:hypothetical protein